MKNPHLYKKRALLLFIFCYSFVINAQTEDEKKRINSYIDSVNTFTYSLNAIHYKLGVLNRGLPRISKADFSIDTLLTSVITSDDKFLKTYYNLKSQYKAFNLNVLDIKLALEDKDLKKAIKLIKDSESLVEQYIIKHNRFKIQARKLYSEENLPIAFKKQKENLFKAEALINTIRSGDTSIISKDKQIQHISNTLPKLKALAKRFNYNYLDNPSNQAYANINRVLRIEFNRVLNQSESWQFYHHNYKDAYPPYYIISERLVLWYSSTNGAVEQYNNFIVRSSTQICHAIAEPLPFIALDVELPKLLQNPNHSLENYPSNNLVFLLDVSASMNKPNRLPLLKQSLKYLTSIMRPEDYVSFIVYSGKAELILPSTSASNSNHINSILDNMSSSGQSNINKGIKMAYEVANTNKIDTGNNRIILFTDGMIALSKDALKLIKQQLKKENIKFSVFQLGNHTLKGQLQKAATFGKGNYSQVDTINLAKDALIKEAKGF